MRVIFVNRFFHPDLSATSQMLSDLAFALAGQGMAVHVVTSRLRYDAPGELLPPCETIRGVEVHRIETTGFGRTALWGRIFDYASFFVSAARTLRSLCGPGDIVVAKTDPPLISLVCHAIARRNGARLVNWVQDLYPETAQAMAVPLVKGPLAAAIRYLRDRSVAGAAANVAVGEIMAQRLRRAAGNDWTTHVIVNWADQARIRPVPHADNPLRRAWGLEGRFVVAYSGNLGRAHEFATLLDAAAELAAQPDIGPRVVFLFVGGGKGTAALKTAVEARGLGGQFLFKPYQPSERLAESLSAGDIHWLSLLPAFEGLIVPSKVYGILSAGRPVIAVCDPAGELAPLMNAQGCGIGVAPGEGAALAAAIRRLWSDPCLAEAMGRRGRALSETSLSRDASVAAWTRLLDGLRR